MGEPVAIVGMACRFPGAENLDEYWNLIRSGRVATGPVSPQRWRHAWLYAADDPRAADFAYTDIVAHLPDVDSFPVEQYALAPRRLEVTDPQHRLMIVLTDDALHDAGLTAFPNRRTDVYIGASAAEYRDLLTARLRARQMAAGEFGTPLDADAARATVAGIAPPRSYTMPGTLLNMAAAAVSSAFDLGGASLVVDAACASALLALHEAVVHLRAGHCDLAIAGGVYLNLVPDNLVAFSRIGAVSPWGACRPFDRRADGFVLGEGAGVVVLKRLADAVAAGDGVYAVIRGIGCSNDGRAEGPMTPRLGGQVASLRRAYRDADVDPATVGFVECHGRPKTEEQMSVLESVPRLTRTYRGAEFREMDLASVLDRRPEVVLVDELAHTNVPGGRHEKRWQDIEELLGAGINVYTTVNVQHLESLNDQIQRLTGVQVWETVPDRVVADADEVELVDIPPEELLARLRAGKIYQGTHAERAAENFFKRANLVALRELALRETAARVESELQALRRAYRRAGLNPTEVQLIEGHGTQGWKQALNALSTVFEGRIPEHII